MQVDRTAEPFAGSSQLSRIETETGAGQHVVRLVRQRPIVVPERERGVDPQLHEPLFDDQPERAEEPVDRPQAPRRCESLFSRAVRVKERATNPLPRTAADPVRQLWAVQESDPPVE